MAERFDPSGVLGQFNNMGIPEAPYIPPVPDKRSRTEIREDFEKELVALDKKALIELKETIIETMKRDRHKIINSAAN